MGRAVVVEGSRSGVRDMSFLIEISLRLSVDLRGN